jgi:hypothetical protein
MQCRELRRKRREVRKTRGGKRREREELTLLQYALSRTQLSGELREIGKKYWSSDWDERFSSSWFVYLRPSLVMMQLG